MGNDFPRSGKSLPVSIISSFSLFEVRETVLWNMYWRLENLGDRTYKAKNPEVLYPCFLTVASLFDSNHFLLWYENISGTND